ncbi:hypothetical protein N7539_006196 [Penicillium diatomitis]|uniref:Uncharacterized protein n=1 Tax=Penicillium diatomitis TaxID=2819901 RepID=A0A9W9X337_9EURO|nr:uncharacterized protein N7539_006196 [Penicillium diatomitis]KAJ5482750.1 hypothetical protein N7539_006196 [Penicillium diatomitis]
MDIPESLQPRVLLSKPVTLVEHLRGLLAADSSLDSLNSINAYLLHLVHEEAVPWRIFQTWLFLIWPTSPVFLRDAIRDEESVGVQIAGIQVLKHAFRRPSARPRIWDALGGPAGVKSLIDGLSLRQATSFVKALCQSGRGMHNDILLGYFDELVSLLEASDELGARPLSLDAMSLYACCSPQRVAEALESGRIETRTIERDLLRTQLNVLRLVAVGVVDAPEQFRTHILRDHADILLASNEAYVPTSPVKVDAGVPAGVLFGMDLMWHIDRSKSAPWTEREGRHLINKWAKKIVHLAIRRNVSIDVLCAIISACLGLLCDGDRSHWIDRCKKCHCENWVSDILPFEVIRCWSTARFGVCADELPFYSSIKIKRNSPSWPTPDYVTALESCMVNDVFMLIDKQELAWLHDRPVGLSRYLSRMVERVPIDKRIEFLQLVCKHCPTLSFDMTMWPPSEREAEVLPIWDIALLSKMPLTRSKELFERSLHVNNCETFISDDLLKKNDWAMTWEEQCMLWSGWETLSAKTHQDFKITQQGKRSRTPLTYDKSRDSDPFQPL